MMKIITGLFGWNDDGGCFEARVKEIEYRYVFLVREGGMAVDAVCAG